MERGGERPLLVILDSHGMIYRAYHALRDSFAGRARKSNEPTWAVYGYVNSLLHVLDELRPTHVIAAWDAPEATFRHEADERYKATREPMPDDLRPQVQRVRELLETFNIPVMEAPGYEADDVLGTLAAQADAAGVDTVLVTLDTDIVQLVGPQVRVYMYRPYQGDYVLYDEDRVRERWGFDPERMADFKALVGDTSDNISGVKGIGEKGALALIERWGTVEEMLDHVDEVSPPRAQKALAAGREDAVNSKHLTTIVRDVPGVMLDMPASVVHDYDREAVLELFQELEFRSLVSRLPEPHHETGEAGAEGTPARAPAPPPQYEVLTTSEALADAVRRAQAAGRFAFELVADEAHPMRAADTLVGVALSVEAGQGWYVPFGHRDGHADEQPSMDLGSLDGDEAAPPPIEQLGPAEVLSALRPLFIDPAVERVAHSGKAAMVALAEAADGFEIASITFDTMIAAYLLGDANGSVPGLAFDRFGDQLMQPKELLGAGRKAIPFSATAPQDCARYAAARADLTLRLADELADELRVAELDGVFHDLDLPHLPVLARMERWGLALDSEALRRLGDDLGGRIETAEQEVYDAVGHEFRVGSPKELSQVLFEELNLPKTRRTSTGWTTDATALESLRDAHPVVSAVLQWRELTKIKSTYLDTLPQQVNPRTGRVHTVFSQVTAATGRLASNDPNLQNIPVRTEIGNAVRSAFVARDCGDDPLFVSFDYSQIELRVLAHVCGDEALRSAFEQGLDIHAATSASVFDVALDEVTADMRRRAKVFNFGVLYGLTDFGLAQREGIPREEAAEFIRTYFEAYPRVQEWRERVVEEARERGYAETLTGRRRYVPDLRSRNHNQRMAAERIAINMPIQGAAADIIKIAMNRIHPELLERQRTGKLARMVLQVHDELIFELPAAELDDVREIALRLMPSLELAVPLVIDEKRGRSWGEMA